MLKPSRWLAFLCALPLSQLASAQVAETTYRMEVIRPATSDNSSEFLQGLRSGGMSETTIRQNESSLRQARRLEAKGYSVSGEVKVMHSEGGSYVRSFAPQVGETVTPRYVEELWWGDATLRALEGNEPVHILDKDARSFHHSAVESWLLTGVRPSSLVPVSGRPGVYEFRSHDGVSYVVTVEPVSVQDTRPKTISVSLVKQSAPIARFEVVEYSKQNDTLPARFTSMWFNGKKLISTSKFELLSQSVSSLPAPEGLIAKGRRVLDSRGSSARSQAVTYIWDGRLKTLAELERLRADEAQDLNQTSFPTRFLGSLVLVGVGVLLLVRSRRAAKVRST